VYKKTITRIELIVLKVIISRCYLVLSLLYLMITCINIGIKSSVVGLNEE